MHKPHFRVGRRACRRHGFAAPSMFIGGFQKRSFTAALRRSKSPLAPIQTSDTIGSDDTQQPCGLVHNLRLTSAEIRRR